MIGHSFFMFHTLSVGTIREQYMTAVVLLLLENDNSCS